jgi:hypothetical protein
MPDIKPRRASALIAATLSGLLLLPGCFSRHGHLRGDPLGWFVAGVVATAIVSAMAPPAPRVVIVPEPRPGYEWQPGYWTRESGDWAWVDGRWVELPPHYRYAPTHWEQAPDGTWQLIPGRWVPV